MSLARLPAEAIRSDGLTIERFPVGAHKANAYIVYAEAARAGVVIDPGSEDAVLLARASELHLGIRGILLTHAHWDHVGAVQAFTEAFDASVFVHPGDQALFRAAPFYAFKIDNIRITVPTSKVIGLPDADLDFGEGLNFSFCHVPGHTNGGVVYRVGSAVFIGDTLLASGPGRTDLPGGDEFALEQSLELLGDEFRDDDILCPGHGRFWSTAGALDCLAQWRVSR